jgi:16S rRNA processing protein RimM
VSDFVVVARVRRAWGRRGEVLATLLTDFPQRFSAGQTYWLRGQGAPRRARLEAARLHRGGIVLKFAGVESIGEAAQLAGCDIEVPRGERFPLAGSAVYVGDLIGCRVVEQEVELGRVTGVDFSAGTPLLEVGRLLIPFAEEICRRVSVADRLIEVALPKGLKEL